MLKINKSALNKIKVPLLVLFLVLSFFMFNLITPKEVIAQEDEIDFAKLQQIAQKNMGMVGQVGEDAIGIDPMEYLTTWNFNNLPGLEATE